MRHLQKSGIITLKALGSPIGSRTAQVQEQQLEETKFIAFFMGKKIDIDGKDLYDAKQKAITQLKVPKSKVGLLAVVSAESQRNQDFKFESITEAKVIDIIDRFEHLKLPDVVYLNKKPYTGKTFVMNGYNGYTSSDDDGWVYDSKTRKPLTDKQGNTLRATTHRGAKWDFKDGIRESVNEAFSDNKNLNYIMKGKKIKNVVYDDNIGFAIILDNGKYIRFDTHSAKPGMVKDLKMESVNEGKKAFKINPPIGKAKYSISAHNGVSKHKDGSDFWDILIFKNKADLERRAKYFRSEKYIEEDIENVANGLPQTMGKEKSLKREALKSIVREVMQEEAEYQKFFQKVLDKAGKSIPSMSDDEKKAFFNKVDAAWKGKQEGK
jgi:hypothetical protein